MLGGLHIEMELWNLCGDLLKGSGWTTALSDSDVASSGSADSFLTVSHLTRTRHAHQVTALALSKLQLDMFNSRAHITYSEGQTFGEWRGKMIEITQPFSSGT